MLGLLIFLGTWLLLKVVFYKLSSSLIVIHVSDHPFPLILLKFKILSISKVFLGDQLREACILFPGDILLAENIL